MRRRQFLSLAAAGAAAAVSGCIGGATDTAPSSIAVEDDEIIATLHQERTMDTIDYYDQAGDSLRTLSPERDTWALAQLDVRNRGGTTITIDTIDDLQCNGRDTATLPFGPGALRQDGMLHPEDESARRGEKLPAGWSKMLNFLFDAEDEREYAWAYAGEEYAISPKR